MTRVVSSQLSFRLYMTVNGSPLVKNRVSYVSSYRNT